MGIDRKDVRAVCHFNIPKSMESFYQESGRAGRDELPSRSLLYYGESDRRKMEFILRNASKKKTQPASSTDESSKKALEHFNQMVEYCEESGCRRKMILQSFGEQVPAAICGKTCDSCRYSTRVAKYLEDLRNARAFSHRNGSSRIFISSTPNFNDEEKLSEFWNRDDEGSGSEDDISDSDDAAEVASSAATGFQSNSKLDDKIDLLLRAEEMYNRDKIAVKESNKVDKNALSGALRESSKQRLLNTIREKQQHLGDLQIDSESCAMMLENECYEKYGKTGKSFYLSRMASTVRWLSSAKRKDVASRLSIAADSGPEVLTENTNSSLPSPSTVDQVADDEKLCSIGGSGCDVIASPDAPKNTKLPTIPSFSDFINSGRPKGDVSLTTKRRLGNKIEKDAEKRMKL